MQLTLQSVMIVLLPLLGLILPGVLKQDRYTPQTNSLIAFIIVVLASAGTAYSKDQFGPDFFLDMGIVITGISALLSGPLKGLDTYLQGNVFAMIQSHLPAQTPSNLALNGATVASNALIHITANTVHIPATAPSTPVIESTPVATTVQEHSDISEQVDVPVATGITTPGEANEKTLKVPVVKVAQDTTLEK